MQANFCFAVRRRSLDGVGVGRRERMAATAKGLEKSRFKKKEGKT